MNETKTLVDEGEILELMQKRHGMSQEQMVKLIKNPKEFNGWRNGKEYPVCLIAPHLDGQDLRGINLSAMFIFRGFFANTLLGGANMENALFHNCDFHHADFTRANLSRSGFYRCHLNGAILTNADLQYATLHGVGLHDAFLRCVKADHSKWHCVSCGGTDMSGISLLNVDFFEVDLAKTITTDWKFTTVRQERVWGLPSTGRL